VSKKEPLGNYAASGHVEGQAAAIMREQRVTHAELIIDNPNGICGRREGVRVQRVHRDHRHQPAGGGHDRRRAHPGIEHGASAGEQQNVVEVPLVTPSRHRPSRVGGLRRVRDPGHRGEDTQINAIDAE
jgi:hypothetical protein